MNFGVIGNCQSAAIIDDKGTIKWCCLPEFDSSSVFASLLDEGKGGSFAIEVSSDYQVSQSYIPNTNVLETSYKGKDGCFKVIDFMPRHKQSDNKYLAPPELARYIKYISGNPQFTIKYDPKLGYAQHDTFTEVQKEYIKSFLKNGKYESVYLYSNLNMNSIVNREKIILKGDAYLLLSYHEKLLPVTLERVILTYEQTKVYWLDWIDRSVNFTKYIPEIRRSALVLKLLSFQQTGAILASVTTSLPETIGAERNWDYRYCWIRDASMILEALTKIGHHNVAKNFCNFIFKIIPYKNDKIQIMYGIRGQKELTEKTLDWLSGYKGSKPVRIGNAAYNQRQNDIYGVLLDVIYNYIEIFKNDIEHVERLWTITRSVVRMVSEVWTEPDMGIWEYRHTPSHLVFSKVLSWVAVDRGIKIANLLHRHDHAKDWKSVRDDIKADVFEHGWNEELGSFTQAYGSDAFDASNLLLAKYGFISPKDPKFISTVKNTQKKLSRNGLMYRYKNSDDFGLPESSFTICSFWLVKALWQIGEKKEAEGLFAKMLSYRNKLGLLSEDLDFNTKEMLGNFPQGYSHLALIDCALTLGEMKKETDLIEIVGKE